MQDTPKQKRSIYRRMMDKFLGSKLGAVLILKVASRIDPFLLRKTGGRLSTGHLIGYPTLLLTTTGSKSGLPRSVTLLHAHDGDRIVLIASRGSTHKHPAWYNNLKANPQAEVLLHGYSGTYHAYEAEGEEQERLWQIASGNYGGYNSYQSRTDRQIPVMVLTPDGLES